MKCITCDKNADLLFSSEDGWKNVPKCIKCFDVLFNEQLKYGKAKYQTSAITKDKIFEVTEFETNRKFNWTLDEVLNEINRDRNHDWEDYDKFDWQCGWKHYAEDDCYKMTNFDEIYKRRMTVVI